MVDYFSRFVWARAYETANQEAFHGFFLAELPCSCFWLSPMHFSLILRAPRLPPFLSFTAPPKSGPLIIHPSSRGVVERNMQLVIIQVRKWVLNQGPGAKMIWGSSIPDIMPSINDRLVRLHGFISAKTMLGFVTDWKVMNANASGVTPGLIEETLQKDIDEMGEGPEELKIWRLCSDPGF